MSGIVDSTVSSSELTFVSNSPTTELRRRIRLADISVERNQLDIQLIVLPLVYR